MFYFEKVDYLFFWEVEYWVFFSGFRLREDCKEGRLFSFFILEIVFGFCWRLFVGMCVEVIYVFLCKFVGILIV